MKLYIRRDKSADNSMFTVFDELYTEKYYVSGSRERLELLNAQGDTVLKIRKMMLPAVKGYSIRSNKSNVKFVISSTAGEVKFYFHGVSWHIRGNTFINSFDILDVDNSPIAALEKRFGTFGDGYELNVINESKELLCLGTALCVNLEAKAESRQMQPV